MDLGRRLSYLIRYPHGCVEQTTSAAFPQLHLSKVVDLTSTKQAATSKNIKAAIRKLGVTNVLVVDSLTGLDMVVQTIGEQVMLATF